MVRLACLSLFSCFVFRCLGLQTAGQASGSAFMLVAGISSKAEMCLVASGWSAELADCLDSLALGDGREVWTFTGSGSLQNIKTRACASPTTNGVPLMPCSSAAPWGVSPSGQLMSGSQCLTQVGGVAGMGNAALLAAARAFSTSEQQGHGASAAIDGSGATYWASQSNAEGPVVFTVDLGQPTSVERVEISWAYPAKCFSVAVSLDGSIWESVFSTTSNVLAKSYIPVGGKTAAQLQLSMEEPSALAGDIGRNAYGIKSLRVLAPRLRSVADSCTSARKNNDARDKYFITYVSEYDPNAAKMLSNAVPAAEEAVAALSQAVSDLADVYPKIPSCAGSSFEASSHSSPFSANNTHTPNLLSTSESAKRVDRVFGLSRDRFERLLSVAHASTSSVRYKLG